MRSFEIFLGHTVGLDKNCDRVAQWLHIDKQQGLDKL